MKQTAFQKGEAFTRNTPSSDGFDCSSQCTFRFSAYLQHSQERLLQMSSEFFAYRMTRLWSFSHQMTIPIFPLVSTSWNIQRRHIKISHSSFQRTFQTQEGCGWCSSMTPSDARLLQLLCVNIYLSSTMLRFSISTHSCPPNIESSK